MATDADELITLVSQLEHRLASVEEHGRLFEAPASPVAKRQCVSLNTPCLQPSAKKYPLNLSISDAPVSRKAWSSDSVVERYSMSLSMGDMLRAAKKAKAPLGVLVDQFMTAGAPTVPGLCMRSRDRLSPCPLTLSCILCFTVAQPFSVSSPVSLLSCDLLMFIYSLTTLL